MPPTPAPEEKRPTPGHALTKTPADSSFSGKTTANSVSTTLNQPSPNLARGRKKRTRKTYIGPRTPQINNLGTPVPVLLQAGTLEAVKGVRDALAAAHDALVLVVAEAALVADAHQRRGPHVRVAHGALAVALIAEPADGDAGLLAAHYEVAGSRSVSGLLGWWEGSGGGEGRTGGGGTWWAVGVVVFGGLTGRGESAEGGVKTLVKSPWSGRSCLVVALVMWSRSDAGGGYTRLKNIW